MSQYRIPATECPFQLGLVGDVTFTVGTEDTNAVTVNVQLRDQEGKSLPQRGTVKWWLFADANGDALATAITGVAAGTNGWVKEGTTGQHGWARSEADGKIDMVFTKSSGAASIYLGIDLPDGRCIIASTPIQFAA